MSEGPYAGHGSTGTAGGAAAGWYDDPWAAGWQRYWDGSRWTADAFPAGPGAAAPAAGAPTQHAATPPPAPTWRPLPATAPRPPAPAAAPVAAPAGPPPGGTGPSARTFVLGLGVLAAVVLAVLGLVALARSLGGSTTATASASPSPATSSAQPTPPAPSSAAPAPLPSSPAPASPAPGSPAPPSAVPTPGPSGGQPAPNPSGGQNPFQPGAPADPAAAALAKLVVTPADVGADLTVGVIPQGATLDAPTLDLCGATYPSETARTARLQTAAADAAGDVTLSTEAVLYGSAADTAQAFAELAKVAKSCPRTPVVTPDGTEQQTVFGPAPDGRWPAPPQGVERQAYRLTITDSNGTRDLDAVYLRRGRVLVGLYFPSPDGAQPAVAGKTTVPGIVSVFEQRLADLPTSVTGGA